MNAHSYIVQMEWKKGGVEYVNSFKTCGVSSFANNIYVIEENDFMILQDRNQIYQYSNGEVIEKYYFTAILGKKDSKSYCSSILYLSKVIEISHSYAIEDIKYVVILEALAAEMILVKLNGYMTLIGGKAK
jgi:hypothetical protein